MHIPDGFLDTKTWVSLYLVSAGAISISVGRANRQLEDKRIPLMGVTAAFVFVAQMLNFPVPGGTSGHFVGAALIAILLGPWAALLVITSIVLVQCLLFQDGGLTALGANIFNMGIVGGFTGFYSYWGIRYIFTEKGLLAGAFLGGFLSILALATACALELALSGTVPLRPALIAIIFIHTPIGLGEGLINMGVILFLQKTRPDLLELDRI
jgi:cobalt/nickel transport system permease protein